MLFRSVDGVIYISAPIVSGSQTGSWSVLRIEPDASITPRAFTFVAPVAAVTPDGTAFSLSGSYWLLRRAPDGTVATVLLITPEGFPLFQDIRSIAITDTGRLIGTLSVAEYSGYRCDVFRYGSVGTQVISSSPTYECFGAWQRDAATGHVFGFRRFPLAVAEVSAEGSLVGVRNLGPSSPWLK